MTLSNRVRCFVEVAIMMLAAAAPSFAQISGHGYISNCDQTKAPRDDGSTHTFTSLIRLYAQHSPETANDLKSTPQSSLTKYCVAESLLEKHAYQASVNAYRDSLAGDVDPSGPKSGATSKSGRSSTLPDSANGPSRNTS